MGLFLGLFGFLGGGGGGGGVRGEEGRRWGVEGGVARKCSWRIPPRQEHFTAELTYVSQKTTPGMLK